MSFSAHADAKGIMQLICHCEPKNILLVHGEAAKMEFLRKKIEQEFGTFLLRLAYYEVVGLSSVVFLSLLVYTYIGNNDVIEVLCVF